MISKRNEGEVTYSLIRNHFNQENKSAVADYQKIKTQAVKGSPKKIAFPPEQDNQNEFIFPLDTKHQKIKNSYKNIKNIDLNRNESFDNKIASKMINDKRVAFNDEKDNIEEKPEFSGKDEKYYFHS